jgi:hypothetical protein
MFERPGITLRTLGLAGALATAIVLATSGGGSAAVPACPSFTAQGDAQDTFVELGGSPRHHVGELDPDRDGVACEDLPGPYKGYATIGYNRAERFFYGTATMPAGGAGEGEVPCLYGDRHGDDAPRKVEIFRITPEGDKPVFDGYAGKAEALPASGRLLWKAKKVLREPGLYYATFEERIRSTPYGPTECPGFSSQPTLLPRPRR